MHFSNFALFSTTFSILSPSAEATPRRRCAYGDDCWPPDNIWKAFNASISGRLIQSFPSAAVCHTPRFDAGLCEAAKESWEDSFWRTNQTGAYAAIAWELGAKGQCFIDSPKEAPCDAGWVPHYSVAAHCMEDVQEAVKFANYHDLYMVVKNTGHDHLGRSSGQGSFSIWTHNLKGKEWHSSFVPKGAPRGTNGRPAVTLQAGEQWLDVYEAAAEQGVIVVGGQARTVGAAGGYLTGGGHSPFAHFYGLAVDNLLEVNLVDAQGEYRTINQYTDSEYFYALRGGAGSTWGVITSVTYKTHPNPSHIQVAFVQLNATGNTSLLTVLEKSFKALPSVTKAGYTGYGVFGSTNSSNPAFQAILIQPNGTNGTYNEGLAEYRQLATLPGVSGSVSTIVIPTWIDFCNTFLQDPNIATNIMEASRLLTPDVLKHRSSDLADLVLENPSYGAGFNFIGNVNPGERHHTSVHPIWEKSSALLSLSGDWKDDAPIEVKRRIKQGLVKISDRLGEIVGPDSGTYVNEANPYERDWQNVFWGKRNYERLLSIKRRIDPTNLFVCNRCVGTDIVLEP